MEFKEAQDIRDNIFRKFIVHNIESSEPEIIDVMAVPSDKVLAHNFIKFADSENIIQDAISLGINPDDRAYGAMGMNKFKDEYTIMIRVYYPKTNETNDILAKDYSRINALVSEDILNKL